jgi:hypothetical protein
MPRDDMPVVAIMLQSVAAYCSLLQLLGPPQAGFGVLVRDPTEIK